MKSFYRGVIALAAVLTLLWTPSPALAQEDFPTSPYDLIAQTNAYRGGYGNPPLETDAVLMYTAQATAEIMASLQTCTHIRDLGYGGVEERVRAAGYGSGTAFATENIVCGRGEFADVYASYWADFDHMRPVENPAYQHVGAGAARDSNGMVYYVLHAAYSSGGGGSPGTVKTPVPGTPGLPTVTREVIMLVQTATSQADGTLVHVVQPGQTLIVIANAYKVELNSLYQLNNLPPGNAVIYVGQKLLVKVGPTPTISPTVTETPLPPTLTPTRTPVPPTLTPSLTATLTATPTADNVFSRVANFQTMNRRGFGIGIIVVCALGLAAVLLSLFKK